MQNILFCYKNYVQGGYSVSISDFFLIIVTGVHIVLYHSHSIIDFFIITVWFSGTSADKEYLLLGDYGVGEGSVDYNSSSSDEESNDQNNCNNAGDADDSSSSTDIDVVVQEYKDRVQVVKLLILNFILMRGVSIVAFLGSHKQLRE